MTDSAGSRLNSPSSASTHHESSYGSYPSPSENEHQHGIIQDIIRLCRERHYTRGKKVPHFLEPLVCFHVRAAPYRVLSSQVKIEYADLLDHCVHLLTQENSPALETTRLQVTAEAANFVELKSCAKERVNQENSLKSILDDIPQIQVADMRETFKTVELLHARILDYLMESGRQMTDNMNLSQEMEEEIATAFYSIFPQESCLFWMDLHAKEKERQVLEMADVIQGIRIYNKHLSKGGETVKLPYDLYKLENKVLSEKVFALLQMLYEKTQVCAYAITIHIFALGIEHVLIQRLRDELNYHLQAFAILDKLQSFLDDRFAVVTELMDKSSENLCAICDVIGNRPCIATELVFPRFKDLGNLHKLMLQELLLLRAHERASTLVFSLASQPHFDCTPTGFANLCRKTGWARNYYTDWKNSPIGLAKTEVLITYTSFLPKDLYCVTWEENEAIFKMGSSDERVGTVLTSVEVEETLESGRKIHFAGYCPVTLAKYRGVLLHGDSDLGLVEFEENLFAFSTTDDLNQFAKKPVTFLQMVENVACRMPQLIHILGLEQRPKFKALSISEFIDILNEPFPCESSTQTATHIARYHRWTGETFYSRALELNNKLTNSSQTETSFFRRSSSTQVWLPKEKWTQTMLTKGTKMTRHVRHLHGLVGPPTVKFKMLRTKYDV